MSETASELCAKCGTEIVPARRVDFTLKDGTRVCEPCFIKANARVVRKATTFIVTEFGPRSAGGRACLNRHATLAQTQLAAPPRNRTTQMENRPTMPGSSHI